MKSPGVGTELENPGARRPLGDQTQILSRLTEGPCGLIYGGSKPPGRPTQNLSRLTEGRCGIIHEGGSEAPGETDPKFVASDGGTVQNH